ncbi:MAG: BamA/TamA family outer membrane protein [Planctomycetota bacterium]
MEGTNVQRRSPEGLRIIFRGFLALFAAWLASTALAQSGRGDVIADVIIKGNKTVPTEQVLRYVFTKPGMEYATATVQKDVERLALSGLFQRPPKVTDYNTPEGKVVVTFEVFEYPNVVRDVIFKHANHIPEKELEQMVRIKKGTPLDPVRNRLACYEIQDYLKRKGRLFANVTLEEGYRPTDTRVVFNVTEGPIVRVRSITFTGNEKLATDARLNTQLISGKAFLGVFGGAYEPMKVDEDLKKLEEYYKGNGFLAVRVSRELKFSDDFRYVDLVYHLEEGNRYKVDSAVVQASSKSIPEGKLQEIVQLKGGEFYNEGKASGDTKNLTDYFGWRARSVNVQKSMYVVPDKEDTVRVVYEVREQTVEPSKVGRIYVTGNDVTQSRVIIRSVGLYPGQYLRYPEVRIGENNLARLGIFENNQETGVRPTITVIEDSDSVFKDVVINVKETQTGSLMFGAGVNSDAGLVGSVVINEKNFDLFKFPTSWQDIWEGRAFRGAGQEFRVEAQPGTQLQRYTVSWREPFLFDRPYSFGVSGYYYDRAYNEYTENRYGGRFTLGHQFTRNWSATAALRMEQVTVSNVTLGAPPAYTDAIGSHFLVAPRVGVTYDTRDSFMRPTEGGIIDASYEQVLGDYNFPIINVEGSRYFTTYQRADGSGKHVAAVRSQVSWAGSDAPVFERFFAGGFRSLRGFQFRGVGPYQNGFNVGGDFMFLNSLEYQVPIRANDNLYVVGFVDSGTVEANVDIKNYRVTAGAGLRIVIPAMGPVPIALDFGFPIVRGPGDQEQIFSFWVGLFR